METLQIKTQAQSQLVGITEQVRKIVAQSDIKQGVCTIFVPHTTAGVTINENADPDVAHDLLYQLDKLIPWHDRNYRHGEGNSAAHLKASLMGNSATVIINDGKMELGVWQGIYFAEFDGPRPRNVFIQVTGE